MSSDEAANYYGLNGVRELIAAEERERQRLSRELHDQMGQHMVVLTFALAALRPHLPNHADELFEQVERSLAEMDEDLHRIAHDLRPASLDLGLEAALVGHIDAWSQRTGIHADAHVGEYADRLPSHIEIGLYRIAQEALSNVARHADARRASLVLHRTGDRVTLIVEDDGHGFDVDCVDVRRALHCGLRGMRERVALLDGTLAIESTPDGSSIFVSVPMTDSDRSDDCSVLSGNIAN